MYFDYSATTKTDPVIAEKFVAYTQNYIGNPNSMHALGITTNDILVEASMNILSHFGMRDYEVIFTSGATESNNLALIGYALKNKEYGNHILISPFEHSSVVASASYLEKLGFDIEVLETDSNGLVTDDILRESIRKETILVSVAYVNSEVGLKQNIRSLELLIHSYPHIAFHSDITQAVGKIKLDIQGVDLLSFSAHKFYGLKGIGALLRKNNTPIEALMHGGHSLSNYRSGTPAVPLILSLRDALMIHDSNTSVEFEYVSQLEKRLKDAFLQEDKVHINSNQYCIPHIVNLSIPGLTSQTLQQVLSDRQIYVSTQSACSHNAPFSNVILRLTNEMKYATSSIRISLSKYTTLNEVQYLIETLKDVIK